MNNNGQRVCPVARAGNLDTRIRRWFQNPRKILAPHVQEGMTVLDVGCGPGFFTLDMAQLVGPKGQVIAADLQAGMLQKLKAKIQGTDLEERITLHQCQVEAIGLATRVDFALAFYLIHELPDQEGFFQELSSLLSPGGQVLVVEPPFHVSGKAFAKTIRKARAAGFDQVARPRVLFNKTSLLKTLPPS